LRKLNRIVAATLGAALIMVSLAGTADAAETTPAAAPEAVPAAVLADVQAALARADAARPRVAMPAAVAARSVCYRSHRAYDGWPKNGAQSCNGLLSGSTGLGIQIEAMQITVSADVGNVCYAAHVHNIGWQGAVCNGVTAGTTGQGLGMEAITIAVSSNPICYQVHVSQLGWRDTVCNNAIAGTTGQGLPIEAIKITV
jgi:uncharacterized protein YjdB